MTGPVQMIAEKTVEIIQKATGLRACIVVVATDGVSYAGDISTFYGSREECLAIADQITEMARAMRMQVAINFAGGEHVD